MANLLNVDVALERILSHIHQLSSENISLRDAQGKVLATDIISEINLPPFANSAMDGFAVRSADVTQASKEHSVQLRVIIDIPAGYVADVTIAEGQAARIMTGAPLPTGADAVVPVEDTNIDWENWDADVTPEQVQVFRAVTSGAAVRPVGENIKAGTQVLAAGVVLRPQEIGLLASLGQAVVPVIRKPRVVIISSGDELIDADEPLTPGKIRDVNSYTLAGLIQQYGGEAIVLPPARDTLANVRHVFDEAITTQPDLIISSAGASVGASDFVQVVLREKGEVDFWRINLRPGKPLSFGNVGDVPFFGLPGNPVSAMVTFDVLVRPALLKLGGRQIEWQTTTAITGEAFTSDGRRSYLRVRLSRNATGDLIATSTGTQSSGALLSMAQADGLLIIPEDVFEVAEGERLQVRLLR